MPTFDFDEVPDENKDFDPLPQGRYNVQITGVDIGKNKNGHEMWTLALSVINGEYKKRRLWDRISFGGHPMNLFRVKRCCEACGLDVTGKIELVPSMLDGRYAAVDVIESVYEGRVGNAIDGMGANGGWHERGADANAAAVREEDIPF